LSAKAATTSSGSPLSSDPPNPGVGRPGRGAGAGRAIVYNTGGYDRVEILRELDGVVDVYLPDLKYGHAGGGRAALGRVRLLGDCAPCRARDGAPGGELQRGLQQGCAATGRDRPRHLVLPGDLAGSGEVLRFIASLDRGLPWR